MMGINQELFDAVEQGNLSKVQECLEKGADVNDTNNWGWTPLHWAASDGKLEIVKFLVSKGANIHAVKPVRNNNFFLHSIGQVVHFMGYGDTPLDVARKKGHKEIVIYLLEQKLGDLFMSWHRDKALKIRKEICGIQKDELGPNHPETLKTYNYIKQAMDCIERDKLIEEEKKHKRRENERKGNKRKVRRKYTEKWKKETGE
ncbi:ankyrin repeat domain-containing protein [Wolbachia endosymbiont of Atemnus politus]|uniref:ankyrin repeat domain-containing protein n=1 Tax=Wolbachia endosymbiont of Atemnus politus TaxID=2682840 RepID=UPI00157251B4|nr:ankyrin repeat domain-containing protein [Wolbachia endosymbiont of Atemnus politus]NSM56492.1 ankyrin repeat domain-containing protein [Wolbachia endosymbiont of Atemnus politus]